MRPPLLHSVMPDPLQQHHKLCTAAHRVHAILRCMPVPNVSTPRVKNSMLSSSMGMLGLTGSCSTWLPCCMGLPPSLRLSLGDSGGAPVLLLPPSLTPSSGGMMRKWKMRVSMRFSTSRSTFLQDKHTGTILFAGYAYRCIQACMFFLQNKQAGTRVHVRRRSMQARMLCNFRTALCGLQLCIQCS